VHRNLSGWILTPLPWLAALLAAYLLLPIGAFLVRLAGATGSQLSSPGTASALAVSVETATLSTVVVAILGVPLAYLLARGRSRTSGVVGVVIQLPIALPPLMSGILLLYVLGPYTFLGRLFDGRLTDDRLGIVFAQLFVSAPFLIIAARSSFAAQDPALEEVAATLGHGRWSRFARVAVPAALPGIGAGLLLAWLRAFGEFGATVVLAYHPYSLPVLTYVQFGSTGLDATLLPTACALGAAVFVVVLYAAVQRLARVRRPEAVEQPAPAAPPSRAQRPLSFDVTGEVGSFRAHAATAGEVTRLAILGASGAGKTLTLRMLAGLASRSAGRVTLGGADLGSAPPEDRRVGYLPQDSALFPHLNVWRQATFGIGSDPAVASHWLSRLGVDGLADRHPDQLSGGQRRRVGRARALSRTPDLLLLDEPFTGLDTAVRADLRRELRAMQRETTLTTVIVTHDPQDAMLLAEHVMILDSGSVLQLGTVAEVRAAPATPHVARLLGIRNVLSGIVPRPNVIARASTEFGCDTSELQVGTTVTFRIDPRLVTLAADGAYAATLTDVIDYGSHVVADLRLADGTEITAELTEPPGATIGADLRFSIGPHGLTHWLPST
jgi:ABC-type sulfate/molybdate transport systems ATPase subunit/ABC-type sulfate transport system permease component